MGSLDPRRQPRSDAPPRQGHTPPMWGCWQGRGGGAPPRGTARACYEVADDFGGHGVRPRSWFEYQPLPEACVHIRRSPTTYDAQWALLGPCRPPPRAPYRSGRGTRWLSGTCPSVRAVVAGVRAVRLLHCSGSGTIESALIAPHAAASCPAGGVDSTTSPARPRCRARAQRGPRCGEPITTPRPPRGWSTRPTWSATTRGALLPARPRLTESRLDAIRGPAARRPHPPAGPGRQGTSRANRPAVRDPTIPTRRPSPTPATAACAGPRRLRSPAIQRPTRHRCASTSSNHRGFATLRQTRRPLAATARRRHRPLAPTTFVTGPSGARGGRVFLGTKNRPAELVGPGHEGRTRRAIGEPTHRTHCHRDRPSPPS